MKKLNAEYMYPLSFSCYYCLQKPHIEVMGLWQQFGRVAGSRDIINCALAWVKPEQSCLGGV